LEDTPGQVAERGLSSENGKRIDTHVHCRDGRQAYKSTISEVMELARKNGMVAVCDMPNKDPPITNIGHVYDFVQLAEKQGCLDGYYLYFGVTPDMAQVRHAVAVAKTHPRVVGLKFGTTGLGDLTIEEPETQRKLYRTLVAEGYRDVVCVHSEKGSMFRMDRWDPERPWTWNEARPPYCETAAAEEQIRFAREERFQGTLYFPHVSAAETADLIHTYKKDIRIVCGITPHHFLKSTEDMKNWEGLEYKTNPPVRDPEEREALRARVKEGMFDWVETDHAPHSQKEKFESPYASGYESLWLYNEMLSDMRAMGIQEGMIRDMTYRNAKKVFTKIIE
jgi:dihydroorotase